MSNLQFPNNPSDGETISHSFQHTDGEAGNVVITRCWSWNQSRPAWVSNECVITHTNNGGGDGETTSTTSSPTTTSEATTAPPTTTSEATTASPTTAPPTTTSEGTTATPTIGPEQYTHWCCIEEIFDPGTGTVRVCEEREGLCDDISGDCFDTEVLCLYGESACLNDCNTTT